MSLPRDAGPADDAIGFERYVEVMAYLRRFPADKKDEVIARLGLRRRAWEAASTRWSAARDAELSTGKTDLSARFGALFSRTKERLALEHVSLEAVGPLPGPDELAPDPPPEPPPPEPPIDVPAPVIQRISAQLAPPPPAAPSFLVGKPMPVESPMVPPPVVMPPAVTPPPAPPIAVPAVVSGPDLFQTTLPLGLSTPLPILPFTGAKVAPEQALASALAHAKAVQGPASPKPTALGSTVGVTSTVASPLPFADPAMPDLTLMQYASLRVELHVHPQGEAATLARYGVSPGARAVLDARWRARFEADPLKRMEFARAYAQYSVWLRSNPR
jgi:hypothetical protein